VDNMAPIGPFVLGGDIAMGSDGAYSSNSVICGINEQTGEQVLEYTVKGLPPTKFADVSVGLAIWMRGAFLGWEDSGMAGPFAKQILEVRRYYNVYYRPVPEINSRRLTKKPGWWNGKDEDKAKLFEDMALAMEGGDFTVRSDELIRECGEYEWDKGKIVHAPTKNRGATEKNHGDRCIAAGVAWLLYYEQTRDRTIDIQESLGETPEYGSFAWRESQEKKSVDSDSPEFGLRDVIGF